MACGRSSLYPTPELHGVPLDALPQAGGLVGERFAVETRLALGDLLLPREPDPGHDRARRAGGGVVQREPRPQGRESLAMAATGPEHGLSGAADVLPREPVGAWLRAAAGHARRGPSDSRSVRGGHERPMSPPLLLGKEASSAPRGVRTPGGWLHLATHGWFARNPCARWWTPAHSTRAWARRSAPLARGGRARDPSDAPCGLALAGAPAAGRPRPRRRHPHRAPIQLLGPAAVRARRPQRLRYERRRHARGGGRLAAVGSAHGRGGAGSPRCGRCRTRRPRS